MVFFFYTLTRDEDQILLPAVQAKAEKVHCRHTGCWGYGRGTALGTVRVCTVVVFSGELLLCCMLSLSYLQYSVMGIGKLLFSFLKCLTLLIIQ